MSDKIRDPIEKVVEETESRLFTGVSEETDNPEEYEEEQFYCPDPKQVEEDQEDQEDQKTEEERLLEECAKECVMRYDIESRSISKLAAEVADNNEVRYMTGDIAEEARKKIQKRKT